MSSWKHNKQRQEEHVYGNSENTEIYTIGTTMRGAGNGTDATSGYTPILIDHRGNRRFHGAFTGGFSAGHFNTVGSVQGYKAKFDKWSSSRNNKNTQNIRQTPMDFMDDEDMATNTNLLTTSKQFNSLNTDSLNLFNKNKSGLNKHFGAAMSDYLTIDKHTMFNHTKGIQLLKKCGWRTGKNIGDKSNLIRLKLLLQKQDQLLLNHHMYSNEEIGTDHHSNDKLVSIYRPKMKTDLHGLGYDADNEDNDVDINNKSEHVPVSTHSGFKRCNSSINAPFAPLKKKRKLSAIGHGLSALEQVDIHDDIYGDYMGNNVGYDTFITHSDDDNTHKKAPQPHRPTKHRARSKDGSLPMRGFSVCSMPDNYQYDLKQQIRANNHHQNRDNFKSNYDGYKQFSSDKMQIDKEFVHKFANFDLTVGSFLCRNIKHSQKKVLTDSAQIPDFIPNAQLQCKENVSQHLNDNFTVTETMIGGEDMDGLRAGLTLAQHIPSKHNQLRKAHDMLEDIRQVYGGQNAEKLARFDVFLAGKLRIESAVDIRDSLLYSDGNKTAHELNQELRAFEKEWVKLQPYAVHIYPVHIYPDKHRMNGTQSGNKAAVRNYNCKQAAQQNMYGALTRSVEMWLPDRLLCKRCNVRDPYHGMYDDGNKRKAVKRCNEVNVGVIESKGEHIAAMLRENESDKQPAILELKQLKTWNLYLRETPDGGESGKTERDPEMKSFVDGILNESESGGDGEGAVEENTSDKRKEFSLFKSIFEDGEESESESECEEEEESDYCEMIKKVDVDDDGNGEEEESGHIAKKRKKFKFVAKAERKSNVLTSRFGAIGFMDQRRNMNESVDGKRGLDPEVKPAQFQLHHDSDGGGVSDGVCVENEVKPHDGMVWAVLDNESSEYNESEHDIEHNDRMKNKKKKKRKRKEKKSKKHKSKRKKSKTKKKHKYKS